MAATQQDAQRGSIVSGSSIVAAGLASAVAAGVTSKFGWAGTIIGAALTTMIITGGSAILNAYLQNAASRAKAAPGNIRAVAQRARPQYQGGRAPGAPGLRDNFVGRMRGALGWFSRLPLHQRRSILRRGMIGAAAAFIVGIIAITAIEFGIGNSYSCGFWGNCPVTSAPGFGGGNAYDPTSSARTGYSILAGNSTGGAQQSATYGQQTQQGGGFFGGGNQQVQPQPQQGGGFFGGSQGQQVQPQPQQGGGFFGGGQEQQGGGGWAQPQQPVQPQQPAQPETPVPAE